MKDFVDELIAPGMFTRRQLTPEEMASRAKGLLPCKHFTGRKLPLPQVPCETCKGTMLDIFECTSPLTDGRCTPTKPAKGFHFCRDCLHKESEVNASREKLLAFARTMRETSATPRPHREGLLWACGVTTVPQRRKDLLPRTLASIKAAGFPDPRIFADGDQDAESWRSEFRLETTAHWPKLRAYGSWFAAAWELLVREPNADRYAIFQDDLVCCRNLRAYLDAVPWPAKAYLNLFTFPCNEIVAERNQIGFYPAPQMDGQRFGGLHQESQRGFQMGRGAVALVFDRQALLALLSSRHAVERPLDSERGHRAIDGGVVTALNKAGFIEHVHLPSLIQHTGDVSAIGNKPHPLARSFRGEDWDALELLKI